MVLFVLYPSPTIPDNLEINVYGFCSGNVPLSGSHQEYRGTSSFPVTSRMDTVTWLLILHLALVWGGIGQIQSYFCVLQYLCLNIVWYILFQYSIADLPKLSSPFWDKDMVAECQFAWAEKHTSGVLLWEKAFPGKIQ